MTSRLASLRIAPLLVLAALVLAAVPEAGAAVPEAGAVANPNCKPGKPGSRDLALTAFGQHAAMMRYAAVQPDSAAAYSAPAPAVMSASWYPT